MLAARCPAGPAPFFQLQLGLLLLCGRCAAQTLEDDTQVLLAFKQSNNDVGGPTNVMTIRGYSGPLTPRYNQPWDPAFGSPCGAGWNESWTGWRGVECDAQEGRVTRITLGFSTSIAGNIELLVGLTALMYLSLRGSAPSSLSGGLSGDVGSLAGLTQLTGLSIQSNGVSGSVEPLAALVQLTSLRLAGTHVSGSIETLAALVRLFELWLDETNVYGSIEPMAALTHLRYLYLADTDVYGSAALIRASVPSLSNWGSWAPHHPRELSACSAPGSIGDDRRDSVWSGTCTIVGALVPSSNHTHALYVGRSESACCATLCIGNDIAPNFSCSESAHLKQNATEIEGYSHIECCDPDLCSGNVDPADDHQCVVGVPIAMAASTEGADDPTCCDMFCSDNEVGLDFPCPVSAHLKPTAAQIQGYSEAACCDLNLCSDNADPANDFPCSEFSGEHYLWMPIAEAANTEWDQYDPSHMGCCDFVERTPPPPPPSTSGVSSAKSCSLGIAMAVVASKNWW